jgi:hypothetical protein
MAVVVWWSRSFHAATIAERSRGRDIAGMRYGRRIDAHPAAAHSRQARDGQIFQHGRSSTRAAQSQLKRLQLKPRR